MPQGVKGGGGVEDGALTHIAKSTQFMSDNIADVNDSLIYNLIIALGL